MVGQRSNESHRSNYGLKTYTPEETKNQWKEVVERQRLIHLNHNSTKKEREQIQAAKDGKIPDETYFNNHKQCSVHSAYDRQFHINHSYHSKLKRDDRRAGLGLDVNAEESEKKIPILSSSSYGHRIPLEQPARKHCRVALVQRDFYRDCGTNIPTPDQ